MLEDRGAGNGPRRKAMETASSASCIMSAAILGRERPTPKGNGDKASNCRSVVRPSGRERPTPKGNGD